MSDIIELEKLVRRAMDTAQSCHRPLRYPEDNDRIARTLSECARAIRSISAERGVVEMQPGDLGMILLQCPVALGMEGHDCNGPDCNCGSTILTPDAYLYVHRSSTERGMREALVKAQDTLQRASRELSKTHRLALRGKRWGGETLDAIVAALDKATKA